MGSWTLPAPGTRKETVLKTWEAWEACQGTPGLWKSGASAVPRPGPPPGPALHGTASTVVSPLSTGFPGSAEFQFIGFYFMSNFSVLRAVFRFVFLIDPLKEQRVFPSCRWGSQGPTGSKDLSKVILFASGPGGTQTQGFRHQIYTSLATLRTGCSQ